jgi:hypothetical protein
MAIGAVLFTKIHEGETDYIPILERGIELAISHLSPYTGMFHDSSDIPPGDIWSKYKTTMDAMKGLARMIGYMGIENIPYRHKRADVLIEKPGIF